MSKDAEISIWINLFNESTVTTQAEFYRYSTNSKDKIQIINFFNTIINNIQTLTGYDKTDISSIVVSCEEEVRKEYYKDFKQANPNLNILSVQMN